MTGRTQSKAVEGGRRRFGLRATSFEYLRPFSTAFDCLRLPSTTFGLRPVLLLLLTMTSTVGAQQQTELERSRRRIQEIRAEHALAALNRLAAPHATVRRDGRTTVIPAAEVVPGDVVVLQAGDVVPADLELLDAVQLQADESTLTGESVPVEKDPSDQLYAGTVVTRGRGAGTVTRTGPGSALGRIAALLSNQRPRPTPLQRRLAASEAFRWGRGPAHRIDPHPTRTRISVGRGTRADRRRASAA